MAVALGLNFHHDTAACIIIDGRIVAAEEERWTGIKHNRSRREDYMSSPTEALRFCLDDAGVGPDDVDVVWAASMAPVPPTGAWASGEAAQLAQLLPGSLGGRLRLLSHHTAHILSGFLLADLDRAAGLVVDAGGSGLGLDLPGRERISGYDLDRRGWRRVHHALPTYEAAAAGSSTRREHSLGHFYRNLARLCIPPGDEPEGSMMALAALGDPRHYRRALSSLIRLEADGQVRVAPELSSYSAAGLLTLDGHSWSRNDAASRSLQQHADLAAAGQELFEAAVIHVAAHLRRITGADALVFAGGCALNSRLNATLAERAGFATLFIPPAPHDAGTALGAALYGWCCELGQAPPQIPIDAAWGPQPGRFDCAALRDFCDIDAGLPHQRLAARVAQILAAGHVVGWVQGGMEFGPRALGHRSILAHPGSQRLRDRVNRIKRRASFRPLAPAVAARAAGTYFDGAGDPFMNRAPRVRAQHREQMAGVTHADGSARVQIVHPSHRMFADLIDAFERETGLPVLLNTSFNLKGAPIIRTARQAIDAFQALSLDALAVTDTLIIRRELPIEAHEMLRPGAGAGQ